LGTEASFGEMYSRDSSPKGWFWAQKKNLKNNLLHISTHREYKSRKELAVPNRHERSPKPRGTNHVNDLPVPKHHKNAKKPWGTNHVNDLPVPKRYERHCKELI
jgi:hypothetical protein